MSRNRRSEATLAARIGEGDVKALLSFYDRYAELLFAFVYQRTERNRADAEDIWQETLIAAVTGIKAFRGQSRLFTWLCSIASHKVSDHYRKHPTGRVVPFSHMPADTVEQLSDGATNPLEQLEAESTRVRVLEALAALPDKYRLALMARYRDGKSVEEVAKLIGARYKAAESILSRARGAFRRVYGDMHAGGRP